MAPCEWVIDIIKEWVLGKDYQSGADIPEWTMPLSVTGTIDPDATCTYLKTGTYNNKPYYRRLDGVYFIWWDGLDEWYITTELGVSAQPQWILVDPNILGVYHGIRPTTGSAVVSEGLNYLKTSFVDRGDPAAIDYVWVNLTHDGAWHDLDLSTIVPAGAVAISLHIRVKSPAVNQYLMFRKNGNVNERNISKNVTQVGGVENTNDNVVALDTDRKIEYKSNIAAFQTSEITVKGWWF